MTRAPHPWLLISLIAAVAACGGAGAEGPAAPPPPEKPLSAAFSVERCWEDLEALATLGPRPAGSSAAASARRRIRDVAERGGADVETVETATSAADGDRAVLTHLVATLPGESADSLVFVAPYTGSRDAPEADPQVDASGAALLLELARVLSTGSLPYTLRFVWLEGEEATAPEGDPGAGRRWRGSEALARRWNERGELAGIRLLVAFDRVCGARLRVARDLGSYRWHRDEFWKAAQRLGRIDVFPPRSGFESVEASHAAFREQGVRPVVAISEALFEEDGRPSPRASGAAEQASRCTPSSLETVGIVTVEAVETIARRLAKIDRFTRSPSAMPSPDEPEPAPEEPRP